MSFPRWVSSDHPLLDSISETAFKLNADEFMIVTYDAKSTGRLMKFNVVKNEWQNMMSYQHHFNLKSDGLSMNLDNGNKTLYIYDRYEWQLITINYQDESIHVDPKVTNENASQLISFDNKLQSIGGFYIDLYHLASDEQYDADWDEIVDFTDNPAVIHVKSQNMLLLMGGSRFIPSDIASETDCSLDTIRKYDISKKKWFILNDLKLPQAMHGFSYAMTNDERYVILAAGWNDSGPISNLYVMDLKNMKIMESSVTFSVCLYSYDCPSVVMRNKLQDEIAVNGYVRRQLFNDKTFNVLPYPPLHLIKFICNWYVVEYFYLISNTKKMYQMRLDDIINNTK